jgi:hypothetical protein
VADAVFARQHEIRRYSGVVVEKWENLIIDDIGGEIVKEVVKEVGHCLGFARTARTASAYCGYCVKGVLRDFNFFGKN